MSSQPGVSSPSLIADLRFASTTQAVHPPTSFATRLLTPLCYMFSSTIHLSSIHLASYTLKNNNILNITLLGILSLVPTRASGSLASLSVIIHSSSDLRSSIIHSSPVHLNSYTLKRGVRDAVGGHSWRACMFGSLPVADAHVTPLGGAVGWRSR